MSAPVEQSTCDWYLGKYFLEGFSIGGGGVRMGSTLNVLHLFRDPV